MEGEAAPATATPIPAPAAPVVPVAAPPVVRVRVTQPSPPVASHAAAHAPVSPAARRFAEQRRIDLSTVTGSGPAGAITYADVERSLAALIAAPPEKKRAPWLDLDAMRVAIAGAMTRSKREIPHYYLEHQVDVMASEEWLAQKNAMLSPENRLLFGVLPIKAAALAARRFPMFNGFYRDNKFEPARAVHVGIAIAIRGGGLAAPALHDTDQLLLDELMSRMRDLVQRTRAGRIRSSEISDPTITVSNLGERGVESLYGIIYPPQVAILGFGKVVTRPWVVDGAIGPRPVMSITLSGDHRVTDGHIGALFLTEIGKLLQEPNKL
jgi:pyruvate dehydrogenase E2 component (dihydrolipoamide acetyltransferase)